MKKEQVSEMANAYYIDPNYPYCEQIFNLLEGQSIVLPHLIPSGIMEVIINQVEVQGASLKIEPSRLGYIYHINK